MDASGAQGGSPWYQCCYSFIQMFTGKWPKLFNKWTFRLLSSINFVLAIFINTTPFWTAELIQDSFTFMGLWSICHPKSCNKIKVSDDLLNIMRILSLTTLSSCFVGLVTAWDFLYHTTGKKTPQNIVSAVANFTAGICMNSVVLVLVFRSEELVFLNFYIAIFIALLAVLLGIVSVMKIFYWIYTKKRLSVVNNPTEEGRVSMTTFLWHNTIKKKSLAASLILSPIWIFAKLHPMDAQRKIYCALSGLNLALFILVTAIPAWQYHYSPRTYFSKESFFLIGLWAVCESNRCYPLYGIDVYMKTVRILVLVALVCSFFAFISSWELLAYVTKKEMLEGMFSFGFHFCAGTCLIVALIITFVRPTVFGITGYYLLPHLCFYLGCVICFLSFAVGIVRMLWYNPVNFAQERTQFFPWICPLNFFRNIFYFVACVHFVLVVFITATPFWMMVDKDGQEMILGFWVICFQLRCEPLNADAQAFKIFQTLLIGACISLLVVLLPTRNILNRYRTRKISESLIALGAEFCAGICLVLPLVYVTLALGVSTLPYQILPHWNFFIASCCSMLAFLLGIFNALWNVHVRERMMMAQIAPTMEMQPPAPPSGYVETPL